MREIKFRAWYANQEMHYGIAPIDNKYYIFFETQKRNAHDLQINRAISIMQYTGLKDKNGKEIYEGDILEAEHKLKTQKFKRKYQVVFNERGYWDAVSLDDKPVRLYYAGFDRCEVIGNIFEDGDLLDDCKRNIQRKTD